MQRFRLEDLGRPSALYVRPSVSVLGVEVGRDELRHLAGACLALTLIFAASLAGGLTTMAGGAFPALFALFLPLAFLAAVPSFLLAQLAQKRVARALGCTTEFRLMGQFLLISVLFAFLFRFVFAAPGVTRRFGPITRQGALRMSGAVPLAFIAVAGAAILAMAALDPPPGSYPWLLIHTAASVNAIMAAFALLPAPGLPGADIWRGSKAFMVALVLSTAALFVALAMLSGAPVI